MGFFDLFTQKEITQPQDEKSDGSVFYPVGGEHSIMWGWKDTEYLRNYLEIPEVAAIINIKARARSSARYEIVSKTTGKPVNNNEPLVRILNHPNYFQSQKEFFTQSTLFQEIFGNEIIYFLHPVGMPNNVKGMFTLPPLLVDIEEKEKTPFWLLEEFSTNVKYYIDWAGQRYPLDSKDIIHINNSKVKITPDNVFWGESPMKPLAAPIANIRAAYEARNVMIENRGALGILSNDQGDAIGSAAPMDKKEKEQLQKDLQKYGITKGKWQWIVTALRLRWQSIGVDTEKLKLFEEVKADTEQICDAYGVPFELLANQKGSTFDNQKTAQKRLYLDTIIPEEEERVDALNRRFDTLNKNWYIKASFEHLDIFQENHRERSQSVRVLIEGLSKALADRAITIEEYKEELRKLNIGK